MTRSPVTIYRTTAATKLQMKHEKRNVCKQKVSIDWLVKPGRRGLRCGSAIFRAVSPLLNPSPTLETERIAARFV